MKVHHPDGLFTQTVSGSTGEITLKDVDKGNYVLASLEDKPQGAWRGNSLTLLDMKIPDSAESQSFKPSSGKTSGGRSRESLTGVGVSSLNSTNRIDGGQVRIRSQFDSFDWNG